MKEKARKQREEGDVVVTEAMRRKHYEVVLALEVSGQYVIGLLESRCPPCIAGRALCVHAAALCQAHHYLKERERLLQVKDGRICTSELCQWLVPAQPAAEMRAEWRPVLPSFFLTFSRHSAHAFSFGAPSPPLP